MSKILVDWTLVKQLATGKWQVEAGNPKGASELEALIVGMLGYFLGKTIRYNVKIDCPDEKTLRDVLYRFSDLGEYHVGRYVGRSLTVEDEGGSFYVDWHNGVYRAKARVFPDHVEDLYRRSGVEC